MESLVVPAARFTLFDKLPLEIRLMIWALSVPEGRIVPVSYHCDTTYYRARIQIPSILQATHESRQEGLGIYHELRLGPAPIIGAYVDLTRDPVYLKVEENRYQAFLRPPVCSTLSETDRYILNRLEGILGYLKDYEHNRGGSLNGPLNDHPPQNFCRPREQFHDTLILSDIMNSEDGPHIFKHFHVLTFTCNLLHRATHRYRHHLPFQPKRLCQIQEVGTGPLPNPIVLRYANATDEEERRAERTLRSRFACNNSRNRRDKRLGLPAVLVSAGSLRFLDRLSPTDQHLNSKLQDQIKEGEKRGHIRYLRQTRKMGSRGCL